MNSIVIPPNVVPSCSIKYNNPTKDLEITRNTQSTKPPVIEVVAGDPVMAAISNAIDDTASEADQAGSGGRVRVAFISAAYRWQPAGFHPTDPPSYEQDLCQRSNLYQALTTPHPGEPSTVLYPISTTGGIFSQNVLVNTGPGDEYEALEPPSYLHVISVTPLRRPRVKDRGTIYTMYSNECDANTMREKINGALRICLYHRCNRVVIGDFGLGSIYRNPPNELAEIWRDLLLLDPVLRGQFECVIFAFEDPTQSTTQYHWDGLLRRNLKRRSTAEGTCSASTRTTAEYLHSRAPTDMALFQSVFHPDEIERVLQTPDPRCSIAMMLS
ncbi:hypothetical protein E4U14_003465 [Claviceps sp. LM454 group G7]|nr:hypothetical protein E4U14_003465 [Claviceps sp. LM454 group G7]